MPDFSIQLTTDPRDKCCDGAVHLKADTKGTKPGSDWNYEWNLEGGGVLVVDPGDRSRAVWRPEGARAGKHRVTARARSTDDGSELASDSREIEMLASPGVSTGPTTSVTLRRAEAQPTADLALWVVIRKATDALSFGNYSRFMDIVLCGVNDTGTDRLGNDAKVYREEFRRVKRRTSLPYTDAESYRLLKAATEAFVMVNCGVGLQGMTFDRFDLELLVRRVGVSLNATELDQFWDDYLADVNGTANATLPYLALIRDKLRDSQFVGDIVGTLLNDGGFKEGDVGGCYGILRQKLMNPCLLELIWSYWHEEGMLVQTMNAISLRFQNIRTSPNDPLRMMEIDPLRPLNNLIWGHIQDEQHRLTVKRRVGEYDHHYGLSLYGKAVPKAQYADSRSKFIEAFHNLLLLCSVFFKQDDDTTIIADGFPILNALKEVHLLLSEGAHNQFGDLPSTARIEMLMTQWMLARPEFREYLPTRTMVAYPERWMDRVDAMKTLQRWSDTPVLHFRDLGVFGEQIMLSIRFGAWTVVTDPLQAANWARFWRAEIQGYVHAYRAVTGVDLTSDSAEPVQKEARVAQPWVHLKNRLAMQVRA
jgi:hypothetical protein